MTVFCLGHIPQISATAIVDCFEEQASQRELKDPAQDAAPYHSPSGYSSKSAWQHGANTDSHPTRPGDL